ncbi:hypothetical protein L2E82_02225 [Cichorium intybus]|uniref:Uncharacterized protein n=1 Tax=Cichorium intybus TaxID=13427 RepID=A0ACB9H255_CICIN|nr:hypothetical protein L2E82_02225 [Cichorium intybus]
MQSDLGKLFIGGISWDTSEERLHEYFSRYGDVLESMIMKDRATGRARGFGFVVFADPCVAERVTKEKHNIDGRMVEAKKAVPRDDKTTMSRNISNIKTSPGQTRKIFVGGLASTVTENDFKIYFEQFGTITDAVVMYDHNTKRPRGFGFITFDTQDSVNNVLLKPFHQLNGKMVEVKRAVPKELSPGPIRPTLDPYPYNLNRTNSILNGGYNVGMDSRFGPGPISGYEVGLNFEPNTLQYGRGLSPFYVGISSRFASRVIDGGNVNNVSFFSSNRGNLLGNGGIIDPIGSLVSPQDGGNSLGGGGYGRNTSGGGYDGSFSDFYGGGGGSRDLTWGLEREGSGSFGGYGVAAANSGGATKSFPGYVGGYGVINRQLNNGIDG